MIEDSIWGSPIKSRSKEERSAGRFLCWQTGVERAGVFHRPHVRQRTHGDRICVGYIATGMADCLLTGGVEHMGHVPMGSCAILTHGSKR